MKRPLIQFVLTLAVLALAWAGFTWIRANPPVAESRPAVERPTLVDVVDLEVGEFAIVIGSQGVVEPRTRLQLVPEIAGRVTEVGDAFTVGGSFDKGDLLVAIDDRDYRIAVSEARAQLAEAVASYQNEEALSARALADWQSLGRRGEPSELTLRKPQLAAADAKRELAKAQLERAELALERTAIRAPWSGRVSSRLVETGQYANTGSVLGEIYAADGLRVRLPISTGALQHLSLEELSETPVAVTLRATLGNRQRQWDAQLSHAEDIVPSTQQLFVVADVAEVTASEGARLRAGQFVEADIHAAVLDQVILIPRMALRDSGDVLIVEGGSVKRRKVEIAASNDAYHAVSNGLEAGQQLVTTPMPVAIDGMPVRVRGEAPRAGASPGDGVTERPVNTTGEGT